METTEWLGDTELTLPDQKEIIAESGTTAKAGTEGCGAKRRRCHQPTGRLGGFLKEGARLLLPG